MTNYLKFDQRKLSMADVIEVHNDDYAKRQLKIKRKHKHKTNRNSKQRGSNQWLNNKTLNSY